MKNQFSNHDQTVIFTILTLAQHTVPKMSGFKGPKYETLSLFGAASRFVGELSLMAEFL